MQTLKPFVRISVLSIILTFLLISLGVKYHWGDYFKKGPSASMELNIPDENKSAKNINAIEVKGANSYLPELVQESNSSSLIDSMNKEQITEHCINFLSRDIKNPLNLELASVNCVLSNFQETFQILNIKDKQSEVELTKKRLLLEQECVRSLIPNSKNTSIENQLAIGMCISDKLNSI